MSTLKVPVAAEDHIRGDSNAPITLVGYSDYQCSHCGKGYHIVKKLQDHFQKQMKFVFRNCPISKLHPFAEPAAEAAEYAAEKGLFWEMHDLIYDNQEALSLPSLLKHAESLSLSCDEVTKAIETKAYGQKIQNDFMGGVRSGVNGSPTFFINGQRYDGPLIFQDFVQAIDSALALSKVIRPSRPE